MAQAELSASTKNVATGRFSNSVLLRKFTCGVYWLAQKPYRQEARKCFVYRARIERSRLPIKSCLWVRMLNGRWGWSYLSIYRVATEGSKIRGKVFEPRPLGSRPLVAGKYLF